MKPYKCLECGRRVILRGNLGRATKRHFDKHHPFPHYDYGAMVRIIKGVEQSSKAIHA